MVGQGVEPRGYHPAADLLAEEETLTRLRHIREVVGSTADAMPLQHDHLQRIGCAAATLRRAS
jgi:tryptophan halogenase